MKGVELNGGFKVRLKIVDSNAEQYLDLGAIVLNGENERSLTYFTKDTENEGWDYVSINEFDHSDFGVVVILQNFSVVDLDHLVGGLPDLVLLDVV